MNISSAQKRIFCQNDMINTKRNEQGLIYKKIFQWKSYDVTYEIKRAFLNIY